MNWFMDLQAYNVFHIRFIGLIYKCKFVLQAVNL
jgi:hypothetical protein